MRVYIARRQIVKTKQSSTDLNTSINLIIELTMQ